MIGVKDGHHQIRVLGVSSVLQLLSLGLFETFNVLLGLRVNLSQFFLRLLALVPVFLFYICASPLHLLRYLLVGAEFLVDFLLCFVSLSDEHFPATHVIHSLVFVSEQVSLYKWAVFHGHLLALALDCTFALQVGQRDFNLTTFLVVLLLRPCSCTLTYGFVGICPAREFRRLDDHPCEQFAERIEQFSLLLARLNHVSVLRECCFQAVIHSLRQMVVEACEEFFLRNLADSRVFNQCVGDVVRSHSIKQELIVGQVLLFVLFDVRANEVPESIADQGIEMFHFDYSLKFFSRILVIRTEHYR